MRLDLFPSRTLTLYLARLFVTRIVAVLIMLVLVLQMLDLLGESGAILAKPGNGEAQLWTYVSLRAPQLVSFFMPYSVLLATIGIYGVVAPMSWAKGRAKSAFGWPWARSGPPSAAWW